eukprot:SAG11_NODE_1450_length_4883_cov_2.373955_6_plen_58_part_00
MEQWNPKSLHVEQIWDSNNVLEEELLYFKARASPTLEEQTQCYYCNRCASQFVLTLL